MKFEFDPAKSAATKADRGIDFVEAQALWAGETLELPPPHASEPRSAVIGRIGSKHWTTIITRRANAVRIISARRARDKEIQAYEKR